MTRPRTDLDPTIIDTMCRGFPLPDGVKSTYAERLAAVRHLAAHGFTDGQIAARINRVTRTVLRMRTENDIPGQRLGTNRFTRRQDPRQNGPRSHS